MPDWLYRAEWGTNPGSAVAFLLAVVHFILETGKL